MNFLQKILTFLRFTKKNNPFPQKNEANYKAYIDKSMEVPRYPPFILGIPAAPTELVIEGQSEVLDKIRRSVGGDAFNNDYFPLIEEYAKFIHLLPASEGHHHNGVGGLFRHGIEVAYNSLCYAGAELFDANELTPAERRRREPQWLLASFAGGLVHDIGKPISDYQVVNESGGSIWNPFLESIDSWIKTNKVENYFLNWQDGRYRKHESLSSVVSEKIISKKVLSKLSTPGNEVIRIMIECVVNQPSHDNLLYKVIEEADRLSVKNDIGRNSGQTSGVAIPLQEYIVNAIKLLNTTNNWGEEALRSPPLIMTGGNLYLSRIGIKRICEHLKEMQVPAPWDEETLIDSLIANEFATPFSQKEKLSYLRKKGSHNYFRALKIREWSSIYPQRPENFSDSVALSVEEVQKTVITKESPENMDKPPLSNRKEGAQLAHTKKAEDQSNAMTSIEEDGDCSPRNTLKNQQLTEKESKNILNNPDLANRSIKNSSNKDSSKPKEFKGFAGAISTIIQPIFNNERKYKEQHYILFKELPENCQGKKDFGRLVNLDVFKKPSGSPVFPFDLLKGGKGVLLSDKALKSLDVEKKGRAKKVKKTKDSFKLTKEIPADFEVFEGEHPKTQENNDSSKRLDSSKEPAAEKRGGTKKAATLEKVALDEKKKGNQQKTILNNNDNDIKDKLDNIPTLLSVKLSENEEILNLINKIKDDNQSSKGLKNLLIATFPNEKIVIEQWLKDI